MANKLDIAIAIIRRGGSDSEIKTKATGITDDEIASLRRNWSARQQATKATDELGESTKKTESGFKSLVATLDGATGGMSEFESAAKDVVIQLKEGNLLGAVNSLASRLVTAINKVEELRIGFNRLAVQDSRALILSLRQQQDALMGYGVSLDTLVETTTEFRNNLSSLVSQGFPNQEKALTKIAAINKRFGINTYESTRLLNDLDTSFQMSAESADNFNARLLKFAKDTGQPFKKVFDDFTSSVRQFNVEMDPNKALQKFTVFQQMARRLGTDVSTLTNLTDQFETIEGGMEFGGKLNMLLSNLGGSFNAVEATLMSQPERMEYIANQVAEVGDKIRGMSDLGQRAILRQLSQTLGVDVGMIRSLINKDKGADIDRFLKGTTDLAAMTGEDQRRLADEMTSRKEVVRQTNDMMIGQIAIQAEALAQEGTRLRQEVIRGMVNALGEKANEIIGEIQKAFAERRDVLLKQKIELEVKPADVLIGGIKIATVTASAQQAANKQ